MIKCEICNINCPDEISFYRHCVRKGDTAHSHLINNEKNKEEWVECVICGYRKKKLHSHVVNKHNISIQDYKIKYGPIISDTYLNQIRQNGSLAAKTVDLRVYKHKCKQCETIIEGKNLICSECKKKNAIENQEKKFVDKKEGIDFIRCQYLFDNDEICGWPDTRISEHIVQEHNMDIEDYKATYGDKTLIPDIRKKLAYWENKMSPLKNKPKNKNFSSSWNAGLTKEDDLSLLRISEKAKARKINNFKLNTNMKGRKAWSSGLKQDNCEGIDRHSETNTLKVF